MLTEVKQQKIRSSPMFAVQLDELTDVASCLQLVVFVQYIHNVSSEVEMNRAWTDNIILFQTLQLYTRLDIKHQIRFTKLD